MYRARRFGLILGLVLLTPQGRHRHLSTVLCDLATTLTLAARRLAICRQPQPVRQRQRRQAHHQGAMAKRGPGTNSWQTPSDSIHGLWVAGRCCLGSPFGAAQGRSGRCHRKAEWMLVERGAVLPVLPRV